MPYGHASMLLLGEGSEATEPYNKHEPLQINQVPCIFAVTALNLFRFENRQFRVVLKIGCFVSFQKSAVLSRFANRLFGLALKIDCFAPL